MRRVVLLAMVMCNTAEALRWSPAAARRPSAPALVSTRHAARSAIHTTHMMEQFEAQVDPAQFAVLLVAVGVPFGYWWYITVPEARRDLAKRKRSPEGDVRQYVEELRENPDRKAERWLYSQYLDQLPATAAQEAKRRVRPTVEDAPTQTAAPPSLAELFQPASLRDNATPRFWSGDNPVLVASSSIMAAGFVAYAARENLALTVDVCVLGAGLLFGLGRLRMK
jgi:hypothetical protein